jgi:hypothetical protein
MTNKGLTNYRVYHITLASDFPLDELTSLPEGPHECLVTLQPARVQSEHHDWFNHWLDRSRTTRWLSFGRLGDGFLLRFPDRADFLVDAGGRRVECIPAPGLPPETLRHLLLDQVLPLVLAQQGACVIHASAVIGPNGAALAFAAPSGFGKSTLASYLARQGCPLLTDDGVVLTEQDGQTLLVPGYSGARLWEDSLTALFGGQAALQPYADYTSKKRLALPFHDLPYGHYAAPLGRFYFLTEPRDDGVLQITPLPARSTFLALLENTFQLDIGNRKQLKDNFARHVRLTALPHFYQLSYPREWARLPEVGDAIMRHAAA